MASSPSSSGRASPAADGGGGSPPADRSRHAHFAADVDEAEAGKRKPSGLAGKRNRSISDLMKEGLPGTKEKNKSRIALLETEGGEMKAVDVKKMNAAEKRVLLDNMRKQAGSEQISVLNRERERLERVGITHPRITVRYNHLTVSTNVAVGHRNLPTLLSPLQGFSTKRTLLPIIEDASGILRPGRFTLLLGPPGSGKTTLLQTLAGINRKSKGIKIQANELTYNGHNFSEFTVERTAAYVNQYDTHYGELTVRETFDFSARCQSTGYRKAIMEEIIKREQELGIEPDPTLDAFMKAVSFGGKGNVTVEATIQVLGLDICADTVVGNAMLRGISGGQKKRVTSGEILVGPAKCVLLDEVSTGLDSSTTFTIMSTMRQFTHIMSATMLVGLLQPQPETYELFDDVILISAGKICFHGPLDLVLPFFNGLGFSCPERRGVADFLQEVSTPTDQQKYWSLELSKKPYRYVNAQSFHDAFAETEAWKGMKAELEKPFDRSSADPHSLAETKYGPRYRDLLRANFRRSLTLQQRSMVIVGIRMFQMAIQAFVVATLFLKLPTDSIANGNLFFGVVFFSVLFMLLGAIGEMHMLTERMAIMFRQRDSNFYPGWCFAIPAMILRVPWSVVESALWTFIVYFAVGFSGTTRFLMFWFQLFIINIYSNSLFMAVAAVARDDTIAMSIASFLMLLLVNTTGFVLNASSIPDMWLGAFWANPYMWATQAVGINELTSSHWNGEYTYYNETLGAEVTAPVNYGVETLLFRGFHTDYWWVWAAVGMILGCTVLNIIVFVAACAYLTAPKSHAPISPEAMDELTQARTSAKRSSLEGGKAGRRSTDGRVAPNPETNGAGDGHGAVGDLEMQAVPGTNIERISRSSLASEQYAEHTAIKFAPVWMTFRDVEYSVPVPKNADHSKIDIPTEGPHAGQLRLLYRVNGVFRPQVLCALMGASGAGKTTLMDVLAGRKTGGIITGDIRMNAFPKDQATFARVSGYVEQTDIHLPETTVEEALEFSARLRLSSTTSPATRHQFVVEVMELVDLVGLRTAHVGKPGVSGLSVEQRKRLTIAVELCSNPSIVFMDEPTSGLDARAANIVMRTIRDTVDTGRTCVCTIHQPSVDIFESFDEVLLLKPGGRTIYFGPLGEEASTLIKYFSAVPGVAPIKPRYNAAGWMLEESTPAQERHLGIDFAAEYKKSDLAAEMDGIIAKFEAPKAGAQPMHLSDMALPGTWDQFLANLLRFWRAYYRNPQYNFTRMVTTILVSLVFGSMFWKQGSEEHRSTVEGVLNVAGVIFSGTLFVGISNCMTVQPMIFMQREVYYRERAAGMISVMPYALAQQLVEVPYLVLQTTVASVIMFFMIDFPQSAVHFFWFWFLFFLSLLFFTLYGMLGVALTPALPLANVFVSFFFGFWNLLSGFLIQKPSIPGWWIWAYYITPCQYQIQGLVTSQLGDLWKENITNTFAQPPVVEPIPEFLQNQFGGMYKWSFLWPTVGIQLGFIAFCSILCIVAAKWINFQSR